VKIIIDADACPKAVLHICRRLGKLYGVPLWTVASFEHGIESERHIVVGNAPQETDIKLINLSEPGDIAVTQPAFHRRGRRGVGEIGAGQIGVASGALEVAVRRALDPRPAHVQRHRAAVALGGQARIAVAGEAVSVALRRRARCAAQGQQRGAEREGAAEVHSAPPISY